MDGELFSKGARSAGGQVTIFSNFGTIPYNFGTGEAELVLLLLLLLLLRFLHVVKCDYALVNIDRDVRFVFS